MRFTENFLDNRTIYPSIFRVILALILLFDLISMFPFLNEIFAIENYVYSIDRHFPFLEGIRQNIQIYFGLFILTTSLFLLGIGKNITSFLVFLFFLLKFLLLTPNMTYGIYILRISLLFFIFVNSFQYLSLQKSKQNSLLSRLATLSIMLHLCLIYISNATFKLLDFSWQKGDALGYFFLGSQTTDIFEIGNFMMNYPYVLTFMGYSVVIFQLLFPILIWFQKTKWFFIITGILMHLGMALVLQLYFFQIVVILHYGFFIKDEEWRKLFALLKIKK